MKASVDTNVLIHLYRADKQKLMFDLFDKVYADEFIINVELENHGSDIISMVKADILILMKEKLHYVIRSGFLITKSIVFTASI